jgi:hypothetical protein
VTLKVLSEDISEDTIVNIDEILTERIIWSMITCALQNAPKDTTVYIRGNVLITTISNRVSISSDTNTIIPEGMTDEHMYRIEFIINSLPYMSIEVIEYIFITAYN